MDMWEDKILSVLLDDLKMQLRKKQFQLKKLVI